MNRTTWKRVFDKYEGQIGVGKPAIVMFKTTRDSVSGIIKDVDEDCLVLSDETGNQIIAIVELDQVAGFRTG